MRIKSLPKSVLLLWVAFFLCVGYNVAAVFTHERTISNLGKIKGINVEVYTDSSGTTILDAIDWDWVEPGESYNYTIYVKQTANYPWVTLSMWTDNWVPSSTSDYITVTWDSEGLVINKFDQPEPCIITLSVNATVIEAGIQDFSFEITIEGTG